MPDAANPLPTPAQAAAAFMRARLRKRFLDPTGLSMEEAEAFMADFIPLQANIMFWIGDLVRYAEARWPDKWPQIVPPGTSPGLLARAAGVCRHYPEEEDRRHDATWSQYTQMAGKPDRHDQLAAIVEQGLTTDESRKPPAPAPQERPRWLLAVDVNYFLHRFWHSGAGVEAAGGVASWIQRTVDRLREKGLTDLACCFDHATNHRKALTEGWADKYKDRPKKEPELANQLHLVRAMLEKAGFACVSVEGMEADDVMASYAKQFDGRVTLLSQDKDVRQCLAATVNILLDVEWKQDPSSGEIMPEYKWLSAKKHLEETGLRPDQWAEYQAIAGDAVDGIRGVEGIGAKGALDLVTTYGTIEAAIAAARAGAESIRPKKREALIAFEAKLETTRKLVRLRDDLTVPGNTRI